MDVGQLREHLAGLPGDLDVAICDVALGDGFIPRGRAVAADGFERHETQVVLIAGDEDDLPHGGRPAGYIAPESPADSRTATISAKREIDAYYRDSARRRA